MAQNIRGSSLPLPDTEPMSGEREKGISVQATAHSHQKVNPEREHMRKSPVSPRKERDEKGENPKGSHGRRKQSLSPKRSKSRKVRGRSRERRVHTQAYRKGATEHTTNVRNNSRKGSPTRSSPVRRKDSPPKKNGDKPSWGSRSPYRSPSVVRKGSPPTKKEKRDRRRSRSVSEEYSEEGSLSGSSESGSRSPSYDSDLSGTDDGYGNGFNRSYSRDRSDSRGTTRPNRKRNRDEDDDDESDVDNQHEAKKARFNALEEEEVKWKLSKEDLKYVNDKMRSNIPPKKVKDMILKDMPVPANLGKILHMDEFWEDKLERRDPGRLALDQDLASIQEEIRDTTGPLLKLWKTIDRANDGHSSLEPKELLDMAEKSITLVGRAISNITHKRRVRILSKFSKDKRKVASTLSKFEKALRLSKTRLFGSKVVKKIERRIKAKKKTSTVDVDHLFEKKKKRDYRPSRRQEQPFDQPAASTDRNAGGSRQVARDNWNHSSTPRGGGKSGRSSKETRNTTKTSKRNTKRRTPSTKGSLHRRHTSYPSCRKVKTLHKKLGKDHKRSKHSKGNQRPEARLHTKTSSKSRTSLHQNGKGGQTSHATRNREHVGKRSYPTNKTIRRSIREHGFPSGKKGRGAETNHKPKKAQQNHTLHPFQNGIHKSSKRPVRAGRSDGKIRSERCLFLRSTPRKHAKVHEVQMGRNPIRVHLPLLRPRTRTKDLHKNHEGPHHATEETKHSSHHLSRRHAHTRKNHRGSNKKPKHSNLLPGTPRICHKHKEICNISNKRNRILRVSSKFNKHDNCTPTQKNSRHHKNVPKSLEKPNHQSKETIRITGETDFNISSSPTGPHKIQTHSTMPNKRGETETGDGTKNPTQHHGSGGVELVDQQHENPKWQTNKDQIPGSDNQRRCGVNSGMGSAVPELPNRGSMDTGGEGSPHQHIRNGGSMFCHQSLHQGSEEPIGASEIRQHNNASIFSKNGGYEKPNPIQNGNTNVVTLDRQKHQPDSGAHCWKGQHTGRLGIEEPKRFLGMETESNNLSGSLPDLGTPNGGPLCVENFPSIGKLLCMETRPLQQSNRCNATGLDKPFWVRFSPIQHGRESYQKNDQPKIGIDHDNTTLAVTKLVPITTANNNSKSDIASKDSIPSQISGGFLPPASNKRQPETGSLETIREENTPGIISAKTASLMVDSRKKGTQSAYAGAWSLWEGWCLERKIDPSGCALSFILDYLTKCFEEGKAYNTIGGYRSAISAFHVGFNGIPVGQIPQVKTLMRGISNKRPPLPKYTTVWDVEVVLEVLKNLGANEDLDDKLLAEKTAMLLGLVAIPRGCELSYLKLHLMGECQDVIKFSFDQPFKTTKPGERPPDLEIHRFDDDPNLCPMKTLQAYLHRTSPWRKNPKEGELFVGTKAPHDPVHKSTIARWIKNILTRANIDTSRYQAHSIRAASSSKAKQQGLSVTDILERGNWSRESTWQKYYHKILPNSAKNFQTSVLADKKL